MKDTAVNPIDLQVHLGMDQGSVESLHHLRLHFLALDVVEVVSPTDSRPFHYLLDQLSLRGICACSYHSLEANKETTT